MDINNIYFYLLLGVFFYFLFTYILENYLIEQENFDPSLVPVSSIVTLAKVAQKLVNGNGTLTNPGNLQIGKDMQATGALTVTGKTAIGSTTMGDKTLNVTGTLGVSGPTNVGGTMGITGNTTVGGNLDVTETTTINGKLILTNTKEGSGYITSGEGKTGTQGRLHISNGEDLFLLPKGTTHVSSAWGGTGNLNVSGNTTIGGNTTVSGNTELSGVATPLLIKKGAVSPDNTKIQFGDGSGWRLRFQKDDANPIMDIVDNKNVNVHGNLNVSGRNILAELDRLNKYVNGTHPIRLRRTGNDGNESAYFKGDGWVGKDDDWTPWRIYGTV